MTKLTGIITSESKLEGNLGVRNEINVSIIGTGPRGLPGPPGTTTWGGITDKPTNLETVEGSQDKADTAEQNAKNYTDSELDSFEGMVEHGNDYHTAPYAKESDLVAHKAEDATQAHLPKNVGLANVDNVKQMPIANGVLENYREKLVTLSGTSTAINLSLGNVFTHTLSGNTTYSITNAVNNQAHSFTLIITQTATARTITFPASVKWQDGEIPDMSTPLKEYELFFTTTNGGGSWRAGLGGVY